MKQLICIAIIAMVLFCIVADHVGSAKVLVVENTDAQTQKEFYLPDSAFSLGYIHSIMLTPCEEYFRVGTNNRINLEKTIYQSYGVGLPFLPEEGELNVEDGKFILEIDRNFEEINMVLSPIPKHWLKIGDRTYDLIELADESGARVKLYITDKIVLKH